jgi:hypothetical protein
MSNFYLYRGVDSTQHRVIPWDRDRSLQYIDSSIFLRTDQNVIFQRAMAFEDLRALYSSVLQQCATVATTDAWLEHEVAQSASLIDGAAHEDPRKPFSNDDYDAAVQFIREFAAQRPAGVLDELANPRVPSQPDPPTAPQLTRLPTPVRVIPRIR